MKNHIKYSLLVFALFPILFHHDFCVTKFSGFAYVKYIVVDENNHTIWSEDGTSDCGEEPVYFKEVLVRKGIPQLTIGEQSPLFLEHLKLQKGQKLRMWIKTKENYQLLEDLAISELKIKNPRAENIHRVKEIETSGNQSKKISRPFNSEEMYGYRAKPTNPGERLKQRITQKGGDINMSKILKARRHVKETYKKQIRDIYRKDANIKSWNWRGPGNIGGRIRAMAVVSSGLFQDRIFIGGAGGGIWKSENSGSTWTPVNDFLANLAVTSIQIDPFDSNIMYASTGEGFSNTDGLPGAGIFKSTNGGNSWAQLANTDNANFYWVNRIAINPNDSDTLFAVTSTGDQNQVAGAGRIYRSIDAGINWDLQRNTASRALDVKFNPNDSDQVMVGCSNHLYISNDGGDTFVEITGGANQITAPSQRCEIAFSPSTVDTIYVLSERNNGEVWRSDNGGTTWSLRNGANNFGNDMWYYNVIWVDPSDSKNVIAGGFDLFRSTNRGNNWTQISDWNDYHNGGSANSAHADHHILVPSAWYGLLNKVYLGNDGGIQTANMWTVTQNSGWTNLANNSLGITQFYGAGVAIDGSVFVGGTQDNAFVFGNNSSNWAQPITGDGGFGGAVDPTNSNNIYANTNGNQIFQSTNGGTSFTWIASFSSNPGGACGANGCVLNSSPGVPTFFVNDGAPLISHFVLDLDNPNTLLVAANRLWRNTNSGNPNNWVVIKAATGSLINTIDTEDNSRDIWVGYVNGRLENTTDATTGINWSGDISTAAMPNTSITDIAISPINDQHVMVSFAGYRDDNIWYTNNGGANWFDRSLDFDLQVNTVRWHPTKSGWVYIGTDLGVFASEDFGVSWSVTPLYSNPESTHANEGPLYTEVSELFWQGAGTVANPFYLCAATHGRGIWRTSFPTLDKIYVDKNYVGTEDGSFSQPYNTFREAVAAAGNGATIVFKSNNQHNESPGSILLDERVTIELNNGAVIINE